MIKSKKIILFALTIVLVLSMTMSGIVTANAAENVTADKYVEYQVDLLEALKISKVGSVGVTEWTGNMTRGEAAFLIAGLLRLDRSKRDTIFNDVSIEAFYAGSVAALYEKGIILKNWGSLKYKPDEEITYGEFVAMICRALGYMGYAESKGGYPTGYIAVAKQFKITTGVSGTVSSYIDKSTVPQLLVNALNATYLSVSMIDSQGNQLATKQGVVSEDYFGVKKYKETVREVGAYSTTNHFLTSETQINVGGYIFRITKDASEYYDVLGQKADVYYYSESGEVVAVCPTKTNTVLEIDSSDIKGHSSADLLEYYEEGKVKKAKLEISRTVVYNGTKNNSASIVPAYGKVQLIDVDGNGKYDVVKVKDYKFATIVTKDSTTNILTLDDGTTIDLTDESINLVAKDTEGKVLKKSALKKDVKIIYAANEGKKVFDILVLKTVVEGNVTTISDDEIGVGGTMYPLTDLFVNLNASYKLRDKVTLYTDAQGRAVHIEVEGYNVSDAYYAVYLGCTQTNASTTKPLYELELFTQQSSHVFAPVKEKIVFNGTKRTFKDADVQEAISGIPVGELIKFNIKDGEITELYTVNDWGSTYKIWERGQSFNKYTPGYNEEGYAFSTDAGGEFDRFLPLASDAIRFYIVWESEGLIDPEKSKATTSRPTGGKLYTGVQLYDIDKEGKAHAYITESGNGIDFGEGSGKNQLFVVEKLIHGVDDEGEDGIYVFGYMNGQRMKYFIDQPHYDNCDITVSEDGTIESEIFAPGNMVRIVSTATNITGCYLGADQGEGNKIYYTKDELKELKYNKDTTKITNANMEYYWKSYCTIARLVYIENNRAFFSHERTIGNAFEKGKSFSIAVGGSVYKYNPDDPENMVVAASWNDLLESDITSGSSAVTGSIVLINVVNYAVSEIFIIE